MIKPPFSPCNFQKKNVTVPSVHSDDDWMEEATGIIPHATEDCATNSIGMLSVNDENQSAKFVIGGTHCFLSEVSTKQQQLRDQPCAMINQNCESSLSKWIQSTAPTICWEGWLCKESRLLSIGRYAVARWRRRWFELIEVSPCPDCSKISFSFLTIYNPCFRSDSR